MADKRDYAEILDFHRKEAFLLEDLKDLCSWQSAGPGSLLCLPSPSRLPSAMKRKFQVYHVASCYFMLKSSRCGHHARSGSSEK